MYFQGKFANLISQFKGLFLCGPKTRESKKLCSLLYCTIYVLHETYEMRLHCMLNLKNNLFGRKPLRFWSGLTNIFPHNIPHKVTRSTEH
jgi:hypothetical protein